MGSGSSRSPHNTDRLLCANEDAIVPLTAAQVDAGSSDAQPNVIIGGGINPSFGDPGFAMLMDATDGDMIHGARDMRTGDFSMEWWIRRTHTDAVTDWGTNAGDVYGLWGYSATTVGPNRTFEGAGMGMLDGNVIVFYQEGNPTTWAPITITLPLGWHHVCGNWDRSGNLTAYVDGVSQGTTAINANSMSNNQQLFGLADTDNADGPTTAPFICAMSAVHTTLLTAAQIQDSVNNLTVQALGANTVYAINVSDLRLIQGLGNFADGGADSMGIWLPNPTDDVLTNIGIPTYEINTVGGLPITAGGVWTGDSGPPFCRATALDMNEGAGTGGGSLTLGGAWGVCGHAQAHGDEDWECLGPYFGLDRTWPPRGGPSGLGYA